jgi:ketosteroid isomerase-like protein
MSKENVELARRGYAALNEAYRSGDVNDLLPIAEEMWDPDVVLRTSGTFVESGEWHGHEGLLQFTANQMEAFKEMWIEPQEFIDAGDIVVVALRFGGQARHTGIEVEFSYVHVITIRNGKTLRIDVYESKSKALEAVGLRE